MQRILWISNVLILVVRQSGSVNVLSFTQALQRVSFSWSQFHLHTVLQFLPLFLLLFFIWIKLGLSSGLFSFFIELNRFPKMSISWQQSIVRLLLLFPIIIALSLLFFGHTIINFGCYPGLMKMVSIIVFFFVLFVHVIVGVVDLLYDIMRKWSNHNKMILIQYFSFVLFYWWIIVIFFRWIFLPVFFLELLEHHLLRNMMRTLTLLIANIHIRHNFKLLITHNILILIRFPHSGPGPKQQRNNSDN